MKFFKHLSTVTRHRFEVMKNCFKVGLIWQGLTHDLSKFSPAEFIPGVKYYQGTRSPQAKEREVLGYSAAWLHHKGRNKHHFEYWTDVDRKGNRICIQMPAKYFAEMVCDRIAATKIYHGKNYMPSDALDYFIHHTDKSGMHPQTAADLEYFLTVLALQGEDEMFKKLKQFVKDHKKG